MKFVMVIEHGKLYLYEYDSTDKDKSFFAAKDNSHLMEIKGKGSRKADKQAFYEFLADQPEVLEELKASQGYADDLIHSIVALYNRQKP